MRRPFFGEGVRPIAYESTLDMDLDVKHPVNSGNNKNDVAEHSLSPAGIAKHKYRTVECKRDQKKESVSLEAGAAISGGGLFCSGLFGTGHGGEAGNARCVTWWLGTLGDIDIYGS